MQIVIDIPDEEYENVKKASGCYNFGEAIVNGTPLPERHGRLIDADELKTQIPTIEDEYKTMRGILDDAPTIIEAESEE